MTDRAIYKVLSILSQLQFDEDNPSIHRLKRSLECGEWESAYKKWQQTGNFGSEEQFFLWLVEWLQIKIDENGVKYKRIIATGDLAVIGLTYNCKSNVVIPPTYDGITVSEIDSDAFYSGINVKSIALPNTIKKLGDNCFCFCRSLTNIVIPPSVMYIGNECFRHCKNLQLINIPISVKYVGAAAFGYCEKLYIFCEAQTQPIKWNKYWNESNCKVFWGVSKS